jgi:mannitol/fructose-specific phosphotransferase system IIA component (Ntr-type)
MIDFDTYLIVLENAVFATRISSPNKEALIRELADLALSRENLSRDQVEAATRSIIVREEFGTTGIGLGFACPHTRFTFIPSVPVRVSWAVVDPPVHFGALDGLPLKLACCIISPADQPGNHLRALEYVSQVVLREIHKVLDRVGMSIFDLDYASLLKVLDSLKTLDREGIRLDPSEMRPDPMAELHRMTAQLRMSLDAAQSYESRNQVKRCKSATQQAANAQLKLRECLDAKTRGLLHGLVRTLDIELSLQDITIRAEAIEPALRPAILAALRALPRLDGFQTTLDIR